MKKIKVGLFGASGRMGQEISQLLADSPNFELVLPMGRKLTRDSKKIQLVDIWIDFSLPEALDEVLKLAVESKRPLVCGTTGLSVKQKNQLAQAAKKIPILWSSNMSEGVAVLNEALKVFSKVADFDFQIEEIHHIHKKDKPSGTAITLQENLEKAVGKKLPAPLAIRGGGVYGVHKVLAFSPEETLVFEHSALNRTVFARGALRAAAWLSKQKAGMYSMKECLFGI